MATKKTINVNGVLTEVWETAASAQQIDDAVLGKLAATTDCNIDLKAGGNKILYSRYDSSTLNSPYKEGVVSDSAGMVVTYAYTANFGRQLCFCAGLGGFIGRYMRNGTIEKWVKLADTNYAVNKAGGDTIATDLYLQGGFLRLSGASKEFQIESRSEIGSTKNRRMLNIRNNSQYTLANALTLLDVDANGNATGYPILHTGNKPSGSYTGNGDATARTISTGGIGTAIFIRGGTLGAIISANGGIAWGTTDDSVKTFVTAEAAFANGVLSLATNSFYLNSNGVVYGYQVL